MSFGDAMMAVLAEVQERAPRTQQAAAGVLGMSSLGSCREFLRGTLETGKTSNKFNWPAVVGTMVGDGIEQAMKASLGAVTQKRLDLTLQVGDIEVPVSGSSDMLFPEGIKSLDLPPAVVDLKSVAELATVRREGPKFGYRAQISGYLIAGIEQGELPPDAVGVLLFFDRSGQDKTTYEWSVNAEDARMILGMVSERLQDVMHAINTGQQAPRDENPSWCAAVNCPFYDGCWGNGIDLEFIEDERTLDALRRYDQGRADVKASTKYRDAARDELLGITGKTKDGVQLTWSESMRPNGTVVSTISVVQR